MSTGFNPISDILSRTARAAQGAQPLPPSSSVPPAPLGNTASASGTTDAGNTADAIQYARMLLGWMLALVLLAAISRSRLGYVVIYYALVLGIVLLVLGSAPRLSALLSLVRAPSGPSQET